MPDDTTDMPATSRPPVLLLTWVSVMVLQQETALLRCAAEQWARARGGGGCLDPVACHSLSHAAPQVPAAAQVATACLSNMCGRKERLLKH